MKSGETRFIVKKLDLKEEDYDSVAFRLSNGKTTIKKSTDAEDTKDKVLVQDGVFLIPLQQTDTQALEGNVTLEAQINYENHSVRKSDDNFMYVGSTLGTDFVQGSEPAEDDGIEVVMTAIEEGVAVIVNPEASQELIDAVTELFQETKQIAQSVRDDADAGRFDGEDGFSPQVTVKTETPSTYVLHIKDADHEYDTPNLQGQGGGGSIEVGDGLKREDNTMSVDIDANSILEFNNHKLSADTSGLQPTISGGNGISVSSDVVSVALKNGESVLGFDSGKLKTDLSAYYTKTEIDQMISADLKFEVVQTLPTEDIDTHTIYLVPKSTAQTNNVYDEYLYINNAWELIGTTEVDLSNYYNKSQTDNLLLGKVDKVETALTEIELQTLTKSETVDVSNYATLYVTQGTLGEDENINIYPIIDGTEQSIVKILENESSATVDVSAYDGIKFYIGGVAGHTRTFSYQLSNEVVRERELTTKLADKQDTLTAGTNITITDNVISASGGGSYSGGDGIDITNDTISVDIASGSALQITSGELDVDLSSKQDTIDTTHKLSADLVDDSNSTNKFTTQSQQTSWTNKQDTTTITTDTSSTTPTLTLADNHEYRYTTDLTSLTLTMPSGDFIASVVFSSGSTPTSMTYDSSIKWSGDDITNGQFVPSASKDYDIMFYYNGLNINGIVRSAS